MGTSLNRIIWSRLIPTRAQPEMLVARTSRGRPPPASPGRPLKILFDHPRDVPIWRPGDVLIWRSRKSLGSWFGTTPGRSQDVPYSKFRVLKFGCLKLFLFDWPNLSKSISTLKVYWEPSETSKMGHSAKLVN